MGDKAIWVLSAFLFVPVLTGCGGTSTRVTAAKNACHELPYSDLYQEVYSVVSASYPIARESEKRGYIVTDWVEKSNWTGSRYAFKFDAVVLEGAGCNRVSLRTEIRDNPGGVSVSDEAKDLEGKLYVKIHQRVQQATAAGTRARREAPAAQPTQPSGQLAPGAGSERGACYGNGTCNQGLTCASGVCVRIP